jgi:hypothetical protein
MLYVGLVIGGILRVHNNYFFQIIKELGTDKKMDEISSKILNHKNRNIEREENQQIFFSPSYETNKDLLP